MGLSCGVVCVILSLAVLIQYRSVTDRQTHRHTHRHTTTANTALSIASRGKNVEEKLKKRLKFTKFLHDVGQFTALLKCPLALRLFDPFWKASVPNEGDSTNLVPKLIAMQATSLELSGKDDQIHDIHSNT